MTKKLELYRCEICGNIVQVMHESNGELVCCGKPMTLLIAHPKEDEKQEKHVPVFINDNEIQVGSIPHPMSEEHHIEFIETISENKQDVKIKFLNISDEPKMEINSNNNYNLAIEYCNLHGLWENNKE